MLSIRLSLTIYLLVIMIPCVYHYQRMRNMEEKMIVYVDMDNVLVDFASAFDKIDPDLLIKHKGDEDEIPGIFSQMDPMEGAVEAFEFLSEQFDTYILSTAPWENPSAWSDKLNWVKQHLGKSAYKRLILTHHKDLNREGVLIDDRLKNGAQEFPGKLIRFGSQAFPDWEHVIEYVRNKYM